MSEETIMEKPPLGVIPKYIRDTERFNEVRAGITRYLQASWPIPVEWIDEYNELIHSEVQRQRGIR